tara:strand:- start:117 stop:629 length:513 start_codon:yes stop_codon:yes gene_type:complete
MKRTNDRIEFALEFGGFYNSHHSDRIDNDIEMYEYDWEEIDFKKTNINYCKGLLSEVNNEFDFNLEFIELESPKFYNFKTDEIITSISFREFTKLKKEYSNDEYFVEWVNKESKSRDGFSSFYSGIDAILEEDSILLQYIFRYINIQNDDIFPLMEVEYELELLELCKEN